MSTMSYISLWNWSPKCQLLRNISVCTSAYHHRVKGKSWFMVGAFTLVSVHSSAQAAFETDTLSTDLKLADIDRCRYWTWISEMLGQSTSLLGLALLLQIDPGKVSWLTLLGYNWILRIGLSVSITIRGKNRGFGRERQNSWRIGCVKGRGRGKGGVTKWDGVEFWDWSREGWGGRESDKFLDRESGRGMGRSRCRGVG